MSHAEDHEFIVESLHLGLAPPTGYLPFELVSELQDLSGFQNLSVITILKGRRLLLYDFPHPASKDELVEIVLPYLIRGLVTNETRAHNSFTFTSALLK